MTATNRAPSHERTNQQEDQDGKNHHKRSVSIEGNSLDETRFEDFTPPRFEKRQKYRNQCMEGKKKKKSTVHKEYEYINIFLTNVSNKCLD